MENQEQTQNNFLDEYQGRTGENESDNEKQGSDTNRSEQPAQKQDEESGQNEGGIDESGNTGIPASDGDQGDNDDHDHS